MLPQTSDYQFNPGTHMGLRGLRHHAKAVEDQQIAQQDGKQAKFVLQLQLALQEKQM